MPKSDQTLRAKYSAILSEHKKQSIEPVAAFCKKRSISPATFYRWKKITSLPTSPCSPQEKFIPVTVAQPSAGNVGMSYDFRFPNGATILVCGKLDHSDLSMLVRACGEMPS